MPILGVTQSRHISASIRLTDATATMVDQYAAFIRASADDVVEEALKHVFTKDREFQKFLESAEAKKVAATLRVRRGPVQQEAGEAQPKPAASAALTTPTVAGSKA